MGSGVYVQSQAGAPGASLTAESPLETIRARRTIEGELAAQAALNPVPALVAGLRDAVNAMEDEAGSGSVPIRGDRLFHLRVAEMANNAVLVRVVGELFDERHNPLSVKLGDYFENPDSWAVAITEHRRVIDAIAAGDEQGARAAMHDHLSCSYDRLTASWPGGAAEALR
ncbi:putative L-lactate dehydrogenase operon regulatory protein [compost metagenome]